MADEESGSKLDALWAFEHIDDGQPGAFEKDAHLVRSIQTLAPFIVAVSSTSVHDDLLRQAGWITLAAVGCKPMLACY